MKKQITFLLLGLAFIILPFQSVFATQYRVVVRVLSEDRKEVIEGAKVEVMFSSQSDFKIAVSRFETTDWEGMAYREFGNSGYFKVIVTHPDFETGSDMASLLYCGSNKCDVPITISLKRKAGLKVVSIHVECRTGALYDARIALDGTTSRYSNSTDANGNAILNVGKSDNYTLTISHRGYKTITREVPVNMYNDVKEYPISVYMEGSGADFQRIVSVTVNTMEDGELVPLTDAIVKVSFEGIAISEATDANGLSEMSHSYPPLEAVTVEVQKAGYKTQTKQLTIAVTGATGEAQKDHVEFTLIKKGEVNSTMVITVKDQAGKPVKYADLNLPDGLLKITDMYGICKYENTFAEGEEIKITVEKSGYKTQTVTTYGGKAGLTITLQKEADGSDWAGVYKDAYSTVTVSGSGTSFSVSFKYLVNDASGTGTWTNCKLDGNTLTGQWTAQHSDDTKTGARKGTVTATFSGNTITGQYLEDTPVWSYKEGYSAETVQSSMAKGKVWSFTFTK